MKKMVGQKQKFNLAKHVILTAIICSAYGHAYALPTGEQVQAGSVRFVRDAQSLNVNQASQQAIVNWQSFGIAANEAVRLYQPNQGSALFRVLGSDPSQIFGSLTATGSLFLINPNGVLFAPGAQVNVGSLLATTMQMSDQNFLAKNYKFNGDSTASVVNQGVIRASDGGYLVLLGNTVENSGTLQANNGSVVLGSAQSAMLDFYGDGLVRVKLDGNALNAAIKQSGNITADGGAVQLATNARSAAINVDGVIQANSLVNRNGMIRLEGGKNAKVSVNGSLSAAGNAAGSKGGTIEVTGEQVALFKGAKLDTSGDTGGGTVLIGGDYQGKNAQVYNSRTAYVDKDASINVDAKNTGNGGKAIVWSDDTTRYYGNISAQGGALGGNGGFVEVSGKYNLDFIGKVNLSASNGVGGTFLLDPSNIILNTTIQAPPANNPNGTPDIAFATPATNVPVAGTTTVEIADIIGFSEAFFQATNDITIANPLTMNANNSIRLEANNNITQSAGANITITGTGTITMRADADASGAGGVSLGANLSAGAGTINLSGATVSGTGNIASTGLKTITATTGAGTLSGVISGTGALTKAGAGTLTLSGANTYTGATTVNAGTLIGANNTAFGTTAGGVTVASGASLGLQGGITVGAEALTLNGTGVSGAGALRNISGNNTWGGAVTLANATQINSDAGLLTLNGAIGGATQNLTINGVGNTTITGVIGTTTGSLTKNGAGTLTLSGNNTYAGATNINAGTLQLGAANRINNVSAVTVAGGATFNLNSFAEQVGFISGAGNISLGNNATLTTGDTTNTTFSGVISGIGTSGLTKVGTGTLTLSGANTYVGATTINAGTLQLAGGAAIADTSVVTLANVAGATLDLNGTNETIGSLAGGGAAGGNVTLGAGTLTTGGNNAVTTYSGVVSGAGGLIKAGTGIMTLAGVNAYTGATTISAGTLALNATGTIAQSSGVANNAAFTIAAAKTIDSMTGAGTTALGGILTIGDASNTSSTYSGIASGAGGISKDGTGTLTLSGANTYTGATNIIAGTLVAANSGALGTAAGATTVASGATLALQVGITIADALTITGNGVGGTAGALENISGANNYTGAITVGAGGARINSDAGTLTISGAGNITGVQPLTVGGAGNTTISKVIATGAGTLTKDGAGTLTLSGANTYTGATTVNAGVLDIGGGGATGSIINTGGIIDNATVVFNRSNAHAYGGIISGSGVVEKNGAGVFTFSGANSYTGTTNIKAGTLLDSAAIPNLSAVNISSGATLDLNNTSEIVGSISGAGNIVMGTAALTSGGNNTSTTFSGVISSAVAGGNFNKAGTGTLTLSGNNTYTGLTNVQVGTLSAASANALGATSAGTTVTSGAALNVNSPTPLAAELITINGTGVGATGALTGTGAVVLGGAVTTSGVAASSIGTTSAASTLTLNGVVTAIANNLGIVGAGDVTATNAANNFGTVNINGAKNVSLRDANAITLGGAASNLTGNLSVQAAGNVTVANNVATTGGNITLAGVNFINTAGAAALSASGRWLVYSTAPGSDTFGGLVSGNQAVWGTSYPTAIGATGNRYVFTNSPTVTVTSTNQTKTYGQNGTPIVANSFTAAGFINAATFGNVFTQDIIANALSGSATSTGSPTTAGVGNYVIDVTPITATTGYALTNSNAGNLTVNPAALTITANNQTKTYGNTFTFLGTEFTTGVGQLQNGEMVTAVNLASAGTMNNANVGSYAITGSAATGGGGFNATNYTINYINGAMMVNPAVINLSGTRTYNGTTAFNPIDFGTINGVLGQTLNLAGVGSVASANAGAAQALTTGTLALANGTGLGSNYTLTGGTHTGTINKANLTVSTSNMTKTYDGTLAAAGAATVTSGTLFNNVSNGGLLDSLAGGTFAYSNVNAGAGNKTVTVAGVTVNDGNSGNNYNVAFANNTTSTINKADITVSTSDVVKTYDGTTSAAGTVNVVSGTLFNNVSNGGTLDSLSGGIFAFTDKNFGIGNKTVTVAGVTVNDGNSGGNYNMTFANNTTSTINKASLAINAVTDTKTYDGTTNSAGIVSVGPLYGADSVTGATQAFASKNVLGVNGSTLDVTGFTLNDGNGGNNYTVTSASAAGTVAPRAITVTSATDTKTYDGTVNSTAAPTVTFGSIVAGDSGSFSQTFNNKNAGVSKTLTSTGSVVDGNSGNNYAVTFVADNTGVINQRAITVTANPGQSKVFGADDPLPFTFTVGGLGLVAGDTFIGALDRVAGETVGNYAINQGTFDAGTNYNLTYLGSNFNILAPSTTGSGNPRNGAGLVDLNPMLSNYTNQQLFVLNVGFTAAGNDSTGNQEACEADPESLVKDKDFILMLNYGLKLPKGVNASCDKTSI